MISPSLACARAHTSSGSIRLRSSCAASSRSAASARSTAAPSRLARAASRRPTCLRSSAGATRRGGVGPQGGDRLLVGGGEAVYADDDPFGAVDLLLQGKRRVGDLPLRVVELH